MASLETLTIEIDGTAAGAAQGIAKLTSSLAALSQATGRSIGGLKRLGQELKNLEEYSGIKLPDFQKVFNNNTVKSAKKVSQAIKESIEVPTTKLDALKMKHEGVSEAMEKAAENGNKLGAATKRLQLFNLDKQIAKETKSITKEADAIKTATKSWGELQAEAGYPFFNSGTTKVYGTGSPQMSYDKAYPSREIGSIYGDYGTSHRPNYGTTVKQFADLFAKGKAYIPGMKDSIAASYIQNIKDLYGENADWTLSAHEMFGKIVKTSDVKNATSSVEDYKQEIDTTAKVTEKATKKTKDLSNATKEVGKASASVKKTSSATNGLVKQIGRIAKTMMIRTAIRALMKVAKQGLDNFYQYSKSINSSYAAAIDSLSAGGMKAGNQLGAAIGSLLAAVAPILNTIISLATAAAAALSALFSLFGGGTTFSKATDGMNGFAKAAGGGGSAMKELLADFDEFNIIASEGGGGGGGGGGNFGAMFEEAPIPQWMIEWKPLLEALAFGTIGAIALPTIFSWIGKILDLFTGGAASNALTFLKYLFKKRTPDDNLNIDIKNLTKELGKAGALKLALEGIEKSIDKINKKNLKIETKIDLDGITGAATQMGILAAAAAIAAPAIEAVSAALAKIKAGVSAVDTIKTLLTSIFSKLAGNTINIKVNKKEYDDFKKEVDSWSKNPYEKYVTLKVNTSNYDGLKRTLNIWLKEKCEKLIITMIDASNYDGLKRTLYSFTNEIAYKTIKVVVDMTSYLTYLAIATSITAWGNVSLDKKISVSIPNYLNYIMLAMTIDTWAKTGVTKNITINCSNYLQYVLLSASVDGWAKTSVTKLITIEFTNYIAYLVLANSINLWVSTTLVKNISVNIGNYAFFLLYAGFITEWANASLIKNISVNINNYAIFLLTASAITTWADTAKTKTLTVKFSEVSIQAYIDWKRDIDEWAKESLTKTIDLVFNQTTYTTTKTTTPSANTNKNTGLGYDLMNGLTWNGENVVDLATNGIKKLFGFTSGVFASGGFPTTGDLFIANEAGAELVGSLGGHTAVANNDQIVEGIRQGVYDANSEQNALLRQQNALLQSILEKDTSVRFGASAALGRTVRQSLDMYSGVVGG